MVDSRAAEVLRIGVVQQPAPGPATAAEEAERHIRVAAGSGAELVVLPELWNIGYRLPTLAEAGSSDFRAGARRAAEEFLARIAEIARELRVAVVATYLGVDGDALGNCAALVGVDGTVLLRYTKVHVARFAGESAFTAGSRLAAVHLPRRGGGSVRVGLMICYDRVFPEAGRALALAGAEVVLVPNAGPLCGNREAQVRTRAFENQYAIAVANYPNPPMGGASLVCDGIAFDPDGASRDMVVWRAGDEPTVGVVDVPLGGLRAYRSAQPWGLADRVPAAYGR
ncbi:MULTISPECIES: carbon-nitrogen hydrolase family protein [Micromonospora]|uniref:carbon-nitrogen hydrolase family protein n=1 Tax=Micromonospora TaxID=1873 RepID=UPI001319CD4B|nr:MULTISPECIES: carbon-nitrogen hydrolase family protein [Micromonospora]NES16760.1 carbon-nitrogen hydrolase family protein [Micromonospora sp. PPF5-17B]NES37749.1 carbon-nitrogen hydrolase family protein [Micromonospora solifontis]NES58829.1 carbon-nitrogen hydrolase family protein [Micromonospora sp. PPF5-6]